MNQFVEAALGACVRGDHVDYIDYEEVRDGAGNLIEIKRVVRAVRPASNLEKRMWALLNTSQTDWETPIDVALINTTGA